MKECKDFCLQLFFYSRLDIFSNSHYFQAFNFKKMFLLTSKIKNKDYILKIDFYLENEI